MSTSQRQQEFWYFTLQPRAAMVLEPEGFAQQRASETRLVTMHLHDKFQHTVIPVNEGNEILVGYKPGFRSTSHHRDVELDESWGIFVCSFDGDLPGNGSSRVIVQLQVYRNALAGLTPEYMETYLQEVYGHVGLTMSCSGDTLSIRASTMKETHRIYHSLKGGVFATHGCYQLSISILGSGGTEREVHPEHDTQQAGKEVEDDIDDQFQHRRKENMVTVKSSRRVQGNAAIPIIHIVGPTKCKGSSGGARLDRSPSPSKRAQYTQERSPLTVNSLHNTPPMASTEPARNAMTSLKRISDVADLESPESSSKKARHD